MYYQFGQYLVDKENHKLYCADSVISDDEKTVRLLSLLCESSPELVSKQILLEELWPNQVVSDWSLSKLVSDVRQLLGDSGKDQGYIKTIRGRGFRFNFEVELFSERPIINPTAESAAAVNQSPKKVNRKIVGISSVILLLVVGYYFLSDLINSSETAATKVVNYDSIRVAVLPVINDEASDPVNDWVKYGIMSMATEQLSSYQSLQTLPITSVIGQVSSINYQNVNDSLFTDICGQLGCTHLIVIKHYYDVKSNPVLTYQILKNNDLSAIFDFSQPDIIDTADMLLDHLVSDLIPQEKDHYSLADTYSKDNKANRDYAIGVDELLTGDLKSAKVYLELAISKQPNFLWAHAYLAELAYRTGDLVGSTSIIERLKNQKLSNSQIYFLEHLYSNILYSQGKLEESIDASIALQNNPITLEDPILMGNELLNIGSSLQSLGKMTEAIEYLQKSQQFYKKAKYGSGEGKALYNLANVYLTTLRKTEAIDFYKQAREVFIRFNMPGYALMAKQQIATTNLSLGKIQNAEGELRLVIQGYKKIGDLEGELTATSDLVDVSFAKNNFVEAKERAKSMLVKVENTEFSYLIYHTYALLVKVSLKLDELNQAETYFKKLNGQWDDIRPAYIFMQAHIEQKNGRFQSAFDMVKAIKSRLSEQWTSEHQAVFEQFEQSLQQTKVTPIDY